MKTLSKSLFTLSILMCIFQLSIAHQQSANNPNVPDTLDRILVNQVGYHPGAVKTALLRVKTDKFEVVNVSSGKVLFPGKPGKF